MADPPQTPHGDEPEVAHASWVLREGPEPTKADRPGPNLNPGGDYDLAPPAEGVVRPSTTRADDPTAPASPSRPTLEPSEAVEQVWSRGAEWGPTLAILVLTGLGIAIVVYVLMNLELFGLAVLCLLAGGAALVVLSYPILITLERPVRVTPEQAVKDFYGALSHHVPHYRRMWLLLSTAGRTSGSFASLEGFTLYWKSRCAQLRADRVSPWTPLKFQVAQFKSDKSAGATQVDASFRIDVFARGRLGEGPLASIPVETSLVRGPDRMWYLDNGTLPSRSA